MPDPRRACLVVIPAYNEAATIREVVERSAAHGEVCVVDDGSTDGTGEILASIPGITVISHRANTHIALATTDGLRVALARGSRWAVTLDAGLSHDPDEIPRFLAAAEADLVVGVRRRRLATPLHRRTLSAAANLAYNACTYAATKGEAGGWCDDISSGFRRYSPHAIRALLEGPLISRSFDFQLEAYARLARAGCSVGEVPISYRFTNSSLDMAVVADCIRTCVRTCRCGAPNQPQPMSQ
jgi:dolichol-phosphate mannosyltransferase